MTTKADEILNTVLTELDLVNASPEEKFNSVYKMHPILDRLNLEGKFPVSTTGTITERVCEWGLQAALPSGYFRLTSNDDKWLGDYCLLGTPFNIVISVKSYKVKERLLVSGSGSLLVPTIGWGFMNDPDEFKYERLKNYLYRGFISIYMPKETLDKSEDLSKKLLNTHKKRFLRPIEDLIKDIKAASKIKDFGSNTIKVVDPKIF